MGNVCNKKSRRCSAQTKRNDVEYLSYIKTLWLLTFARKREALLCILTISICVMLDEDRLSKDCP